MAARNYRFEQKIRAHTSATVQAQIKNVQYQYNKGEYMAQIKEKTIENQIKKWLESQGYWWMKVHGDMFQKSGVPDILACINGKFVGIEVKRPGGVVSELQKYNIEKIQAAGGVAFVAYSVEDVRINLDRFHVI